MSTQRERRNEYQRKWRAKHKDRINAERRQKRAENPEHYNKVWREWYNRKGKEAQRKKCRGYYRKHREEILENNRRYREKIKGIKEYSLYPNLRNEFPQVFLFTKRVPDAYDAATGTFIEVKLANTKCINWWRKPSKYFPNLFFRHMKKRNLFIDEQIEDYPKPLLVIVYHYKTGKEIARKLFREKTLSQL